MAVATAQAMNGRDRPCFNVVGVELPTQEGTRRAKLLAEGTFPFPTTDHSLSKRLGQAVGRGNLSTSTDPTSYEQAHVAVMNVELNLDPEKKHVDFTSLKRAATTLGERLPKDALVVVSTTVPPGTTERVIAPAIDNALEKRGMKPGDILVSHSYERVMPGDNYLDSIINFWRVFSGTTSRAADACEAFFEKIVNTDEYPMSRLHSTTASEMAKVLENTFRAANIGLIGEWANFAEKAGVDLYQVVEAIRVRPTHRNIMLPGLGVGGYCLTKDPLFPSACSPDLLGIEPVPFPISTKIVDINRAMPGNSIKRLTQMLGGNMAGKKVLVAGASYRPGVGDTRHSPSLAFARLLADAGAAVELHDPLVETLDLEFPLHSTLPGAEGYDAIVLAVPHKEYGAPGFLHWLHGVRGVVLDTCGMLSAPVREAFRAKGTRVETTGRGDGL